MRMRDVARFFDKESAYDGYTDALLFKCQFSSFTNSSADGSTNRRRSLSTASDVVIPTRRCIRLGGDRWIVSTSTDDSFQDSIVRVNYDMKRVTHLLNILTVAQACASGSGTQAYAQLHYFKDSSNSLSDSEIDTFWNVFFAQSETLWKGAFLRDASGRLYRVRQDYQVTEGFVIAQTDQLDDGALVTATFKTGTFDPVTDTFGSGTQAVPVIQFEPSKFYRFRQKAEYDLRPGDRAVFVGSLTPKVGQQFTMQSKLWQAVVVQPEGDGYAIHARLA